jgi:WD40 repeat protein/serine/threonine protein kinase
MSGTTRSFRPVPGPPHKAAQEFHDTYLAPASGCSITVAVSKNQLRGRVLGGFVLGDRLAEGGFGTVYRAEQPDLGREAVIKVMHRDLDDDAVSRQRFTREAYLASRLDHPYAAHIYTFGIEHDGLRWLAMEYVHGITLAQWLQDHGPLPLEDFVPFFERIAEVVQAAHDRGIIHRDLKPENIMVLERAGHLLPKLLDFGIAKLITDDTAITRRDQPAAGSRARQQLTHNGSAIGSPPYMAPEQWTGCAAVGPATDIYALGVIACEMLTRRLPFNANRTDEYTHLHLHAPVPPLGDDVSPGLNRVFERALAKSPADRFATVQELAAAFRAAFRIQAREQLRAAAQQWQDRARPQELLWRGRMVPDLERTVSASLSPLENAFVHATRRQTRRTTWLRRSLCTLIVLAVFGLFQYRSALEARLARRVAEAAVIQSELEQGRQALLHEDPTTAQQHLAEAYRRGDHSPSTAFMLARAAEPAAAELARFSSPGRMWSAAFSPDSRQLVTASDQGAQLRDAVTYRLLFALSNGEVYSAVFSADSVRLATVSADAVRIWNTSTGTLLHKLSHGKPDYYRVALSPDGRLIAAIDAKGTAAHVWRTDGTFLTELNNDGSEFPSISFSHDGSFLATGGGNDVRVFDTRTWTQTVTLTGPRIRSLSFDPTEHRLATASADGDLSIWDLPDGRRVHHLREIGEPLDRVAFSPNGRFVVTATRDGAEQLWDADSGKLQTQLHRHRGKIRSVEFDSTSSRIVSAGTDGLVVIAEAENGFPVAVLDGPQNIVMTARFDPSSKRVIAASWDGTSRVWSAGSLHRRWASGAVSDDCGIITTLEPDSRFIAVGCREKGTRVWDTAHDRLLAELPAVTRPGDNFEPALPAVSADGARAAIARYNEVEVYELPAARLLYAVAHAAAVSAVTFAPAGHDLISGAVDGSVLITPEGCRSAELPPARGGIDAVGVLEDGRIVASDASSHLRIFDPDRTLLTELSTTTRTMLLRPSPHGERLVTIPSYTGKVAPPVLWDLSTYTAIAALAGHTGQVFSARFADRHILTAGGDGSARLWDARTGHEEQVYRGSTRYFRDAALDSAGHVIAGGGDGVLYFWDMATGQPLWQLPTHTSQVIGLHLEHGDIVTRGFGGDISRWQLTDLAASGTHL